MEPIHVRRRRRRWRWAVRAHIANSRKLAKWNSSLALYYLIVYSVEQTSQRTNERTNEQFAAYSASINHAQLNVKLIEMSLVIGAHTQFVITLSNYPIDSMGPSHRR